MRLLSDDELGAYQRMRLTITANHARNQTRTNYAEAEQLIASLNLRLPNGRTVEQTPMYWPRKAIEVFSSRLLPEFYSMRDNPSLLRQLEAAWSEQVEFAEALAIKAALRLGPAFIFTTLGDQSAGEPEIVVTPRSALRATAEIDPRTNMVTAALELLGSGRANLYLPGRTVYVQHISNRAVVLDEFPAPGRVMCAPYIHDADVDKPFGSSRITKSVMGFTDAAVRTFMRSEVSAEWYSAPRERVLGVGPEAFEDAPGWLHEIGIIQALPDIHPEDERDVPDSLRRAEFVTYPQMSMQPFSDQFRLVASQFSGASSIPLQYLGIVQDSNPTSAAAIEAQDVDLVRAAKDQHKSFNIGRVRLAQNILTLIEPDVALADMRTLRPLWGDPRHRGILETGQFVAQQVQVGNMTAGAESTLSLLPITTDQARAIAADNARTAGSGILASVLERANANSPAD